MIPALSALFLLVTIASFYFDFLADDRPMPVRQSPYGPYPER